MAHSSTELSVYSPDRISANAFQQLPNLRVLSIQNDKDIDPHALDDLKNLEKLTIRNILSASSLNLLQKLPNVKEFEININRLDEKTQCQLIEKLANAQVTIKVLPNRRECTCALAYLDAANSRAPCFAQYCEHSSCAAIKNNYDASTRTFKAPPSILRSDDTRPTWLTLSDGTNFVDTHNDEKSDPNDNISDVENNENENNTPIEKSSWYHQDDHDSSANSMNFILLLLL
ncbi:unnamed protein product [Rotaria sordida]|uniref:Uncharacterized protein n=1 Tax=Rotaria sordida TaxID=392033 RepID=A0A819N4Z1_9BILA|nr:unnamed protein product [Rotaria sordida]